MLPNFLVVGAAKSGTTSLYHYLGQHPEIYVSPVKEPEYFSFPETQPDFIGPNRQPMNGGIITSTNEYHLLFDDVTHEKAIGECSTSYLFLPQAAANIRHAIPGCKIIMILRNPIDRTFSNYLDHVMTLNEELTFEDALQAESERAAENWRWGYLYSRQSFYNEQVKRYYDLFDSRQISVYLFDDLAANPVGFMQALYHFLEVDDHFIPDVRTRYNPSGFPRSMWLQRFIFGQHRSLRVVTPLIPKNVKQTVKRILMKLNLQNKSMLGVTRSYLRDLFAKDLEALEPLIGKDLAYWRA